jgi:hypothetical protein
LFFLKQNTTSCKVDFGDLNVLAFGGFFRLREGGKKTAFSHLPARQG